MTIRDLIPSEWGSRKVPGTARRGDPILSFQRQMNRLFDDFFSGSGFLPFREFEEQAGRFTPQIDVQETEREIRVTAELPGMDEKDIDISVTGDSLVLRGEKKEERTEDGNGGGARYIERSYGMFERVIPFTSEIDPDKVDARFKKGVLTITVPKPKEAQSKTKKIAVRAGE